ncbi:MAG TPA: arylamine N-acetyltransferase [Actinospica sp.]|nr:arylamine N-acetyltransferase [Actinospica sp.]
MTRATTPGPIRPDRRADVEGYLARLGLERPARPDVGWLFAAHRAHMALVPYENLEIQLGRPTTVHPVESIARIARGRGGYCFHLNGALGTLLACLGYEVTRHLGQVNSNLDIPETPELLVNHQVLVVHCEGAEYFVDCGLGDAPFEPLPLRAGESVQGPFTYRLAPWPLRPGGWRFVHDPRALSFPSMVFAPEPVRVAAFAQPHHRLSTSPDSGFVQAAVVSRRDAEAIEVLRGLVFTRIDATGPARHTVETRAEWYELLADVYRLHLPEVDALARERLWARVARAHEDWLVRQEAAEAVKPPAAP